MILTCIEKYNLLSFYLFFLWSEGTKNITKRTESKNQPMLQRLNVQRCAKLSKMPVLLFRDVLACMWRRLGRVMSTVRCCCCLFVACGCWLFVGCLLVVCCLFVFYFSHFFPLPLPLFLFSSFFLCFDVGCGG